MPGDGVTRWYSKFAPSAYAELGFAPTMVEDGREEPDLDFGFYGLMTWRRREIIDAIAARTGKPVLEMTSLLTPRAERNAEMRRAKVILQIRANLETQWVSSTRCASALHMGRPIVAEPHGIKGPWEEIVPFSDTQEIVLRGGRGDGGALAQRARRPARRLRPQAAAVGARRSAAPRDRHHLKGDKRLDHLEELRAKGLTVLGPLAPAEIAETNAFLLSRPVFVGAHVPQTARNRDGGAEVVWSRDHAEGSECVCVKTSDAILAPHLFERGLHATDIAAAYLERDPPVAYSMNAFWTRPGTEAIRADIQDFHRDADDVRFLAMFFYLNDVLNDDAGPHDLIGPDGVCRTVVGPAGTVFLADTSLPHRGRKPTSGERGMAWFRFGVSDRPPANIWDKVEPIPRELMGSRYPTDPRLQEVVRLLVR